MAAQDRGLRDVRGRALLLLMLFSDVTEDDAATRIRVGSHADVARALVDATGRAGDVFLCHPFLVHAASWPHRGTAPRFIGQPCIHHPEGEWLGGFEYDDLSHDSAVVRAVGRAVGSSDHALATKPR